MKCILKTSVWKEVCYSDTNIDNQRDPQLTVTWTSTVMSSGTGRMIDKEPLGTEVEGNQHA